MEQNAYQIENLAEYCAPRRHTIEPVSSLRVSCALGYGTTAVADTGSGIGKTAKGGEER